MLNLKVSLRALITGSRIEGATVTVDGQTKQTDMQGQAQFNITPGQISIGFEKRGYGKVSPAFQGFISEDTEVDFAVRPERFPVGGELPRKGVRAGEYYEFLLKKPSLSKEEKEWLNWFKTNWTCSALEGEPNNPYLIYGKLDFEDPDSIFAMTGNAPDHVYMADICEKNINMFCIEITTGCKNKRWNVGETVYLYIIPKVAVTFNGRVTYLGKSRYMGTYDTGKIVTIGKAEEVVLNFLKPL